jgi:hypothetical protein
VVHSHPTRISPLSTWTNNIVKKIRSHYTLSTISHIIGPSTQMLDMNGMKMYNQAFLVILARNWNRACTPTYSFKIKGIPTYSVFEHNSFFFLVFYFLNVWKPKSQKLFLCYFYITSEREYRVLPCDLWFEKQTQKLSLSVSEFSVSPTATIFSLPLSHSILYREGFWSFEWCRRIRRYDQHLLWFYDHVQGIVLSYFA